MKTKLHTRCSVIPVAAFIGLATLNPRPAFAQSPEPDSFNPGANGRVLSTVVQTGGKIVVGGGFTRLGGQTRNYIACLNADGTLDSGFDPGANNWVLSLAVQPDGRILVGGTFTRLAGQSRLGIARLYPDGSLDGSFNPGASDDGLGLTIQADEKILVHGTFTQLGGQTHYNVGRLNSSGSVDGGFNPGANEGLWSLAVQADGKILVSGRFTTLGGQTRNYLGRLNNTGPAAQSLDFDGRTITWLRGGTGPEVWRTTFDLSTDGSTWTRLGPGTRRTGGWQRAVVNPPPSGSIRARGYATSGRNNGSGWFVEAQVQFRNAPTILAEPRGLTAIAGTTASFSVSATGLTPLAYQWRKDGVPLADGGNVSGATTSVLTLANIRSDDAGEYTVIVSNAAGSATSQAVSLTVLLPPQFLLQPKSQAARVGDNAVLSVIAFGTTPLNYQWFRGDEMIGGATNNTLVLWSVGTSEAGRYSVMVWNVAGWVMSDEAEVVVPHDPANGQPPSLLTYSVLPPKEDGKDSLVLITHGWSVPWESVPPAVPWLDEFASVFNAYLTTDSSANWQVVPYKWLENSHRLLPDWAADNGAKEGANLGLVIVKQQWKHVHLIGFSAGAALIQGAMDMIHALDVHDAIAVHETFLDPYLQTGYLGRSTYGARADWADCYFAHDFKTDDLGHLIFQPSLTEGRLVSAYNVDVTQIDPSPWIVGAYCGDLLDPSRVCGLEVVSHHDWPHRFYTNTVFGSLSGTEGLGFPLSKEGGGWENRDQYRRGEPPRVLGNLEMVVQNEAQTILNPALRVQELVFQVSPSGVVELVQKGFRALTGTGGGSSPKTHQPGENGGLPVWISFAVPITNQVNFVTFEAQFESAEGAVGLLSAYWGTNLIGTLDERVVIPGLRQYSFGLPEVAPSGLYLLGFRLDPHSAVPSHINVSDIATGFAGVAMPIQLQIAFTATNANPIISLTAAPGFYYQIQTSPDLVNWTPFASVLNTNGMARIIDTTTSAANRCYYRALMP